MAQSIEAMMDSDKLLLYLTAAKISDGSWRGTTKRFILKWIDKLHLYHELICMADHLSENTHQHTSSEWGDRFEPTATSSDQFQFAAGYT
jgi:hypothetical protein